MGFVIRRGTRDKPRYYVRYVDVGGGEKTRRVPALTRVKAEEFLHEVEDNLMRGRLGMDAKGPAPIVGPLMDEWLEALANRNAADDRSRFKRHVRPAFAHMTLPQALEIGPVMNWVSRQRAARKEAAGGEKTGLSDGSIRHNLNLLSRFFSWAIEQGHAKVNPVRMIPTGRRPQQAQKRDIPWLADDDLVVKLMQALEEPVNLMFFLGNRSGLRTGEICGLRMSDLGYLKDRVIRVRYSYDGPLKEDKAGVGKMKWVPSPADAEEFLGVWLKRRKLQGAQPEDLVFVCPVSPKNPRKHPWKGYRKEHVEDCWNEVAKEHKVELTWYQATRHSFVTRHLEAGVSLDEVSEAVGHSSPVVTKRFYDHHVRRSFSDALTTGLKR
jgi:integrase